MHGCSIPIIDPEGRHALMTFNVRYANWGYTIILVLRRPAEVWQVEFEQEGMRFHFDFTSE